MRTIGVLIYSLLVIGLVSMWIDGTDLIALNQKYIDVISPFCIGGAVGNVLATISNMVEK